MMNCSNVRWGIRLGILFAFIAFDATFANATEVANLLLGGAEFSSMNGLAKLILGASLNTFSVWLSGKEIYKSAKEYSLFNAGRFFITNSGNHVVWLLSDKFHSATVDKGPKAPSKNLTKNLQKNAQKEIQKTADAASPIALIFFERGKETKSYTLRELLGRENLVSRSPSHTQWVMNYRNSDSTPAEKQGAGLAANGTLLELETTSFKTYSFDMVTGNMTYAADSEAFTKADAIVFGKVNANSTRLVRINSIHVIKDRHGDLRGLFEVKADDPTKTLRDGQTYTIVLNKKGEHWEVVEPRCHIDVSYHDV